MTQSPNAQQIESWNGPTGQNWIKNQESIDRQILPFGEEAIRRAHLSEGDRVLDIGCGCGATLLQLRELVGATGQVTGLDVSAPMLDVALERIDAAGLNNVKVLEGDAAVTDFKDAECDVLFSRFGIMFFSDPEAAFANLLTALRPGGRMSFVCWQAASANTWMAGPIEALREIVDLPPGGDPNAPGPFAFQDADRVQALITAAGFKDVAYEPWLLEMTLAGGTDLDEAAKSATGVGPTGNAVRLAGPENFGKCLEAIKKWIEPRMTPDGVKLAAATWMFSGQRAD